MPGPFRDSTEARIAMLEEENAALAEEVRELEARVPENQGPFLRRLEEQRDEARRDLEALRAAPLSPHWPAGPPTARLPESAEERKVVVIAGAFLFALFTTLALFAHSRGGR